MAGFNEYLKNGTEEEAYKQTRIIDEKLKLSNETEEKIKKIDKDINILAVAEVYCPDCRAVISFLEKFSRINDKIKIEYITREEAQHINITKVERIPTLFYHSEDKVSLFLLEFPNVVREKMNNNPENFDEIKMNFRLGKYNEEIEKELVDYFTKL